MTAPSRVHPRHRTLEDWLAWQEQAHTRPIDLGLDRVAQVADGLQLRPAPMPVVIVGGTNGKGSTVAMLEAIYLAAGYRVGCYTSPHLIHYNERIRINGQPVADESICAAFEAIDQARGEISLSYFEFGTLAALWLFRREPVDVMVLEVGLGGRLDAVNILDADVAVVTAVGIDHQAFLGDDRESIGFEKAGIFRSGRVAVCGDADPPARLLDHAHSIGARLLLAGRDFAPLTGSRTDTWQYRGAGLVLEGLPSPALAGSVQYRNAASAITAVVSLRERLPVTQDALGQGLATARLPGRFQLLREAPAVWVDVAHNPQGADSLALNLQGVPCRGRTLAVMGVMADKDVDGILHPLLEIIHGWYVASPAIDRALAASVLADRVAALTRQPVQSHESVDRACRAALAAAGPEDRVIVFGSFFTVAEVLSRNFSVFTSDRPLNHPQHRSTCCDPD
ncbi:dihydrofolate synthase / folylpolyglutamate synthase [Ectothiorhodospira magna]|uniref:Dihydrofolate synthase/folylpolyglutamate synthase n=1 Tax=Ectothiorhodospira magna TaxID=867345 RepID=A0A1H9E595_9GAMM|nr:bifunctional tetrahydrofolate synthase/dihydrofolate synthase [Ectothiorhodospira magna]SEQ20861.1 dihydrofolate synthase / folylpolyglutamate synthase [Ectothiorhodospira magna]